MPLVLLFSSQLPPLSIYVDGRNGSTFFQDGAILLTSMGLSDRREALLQQRTVSFLPLLLSRTVNLPMSNLVSPTSGSQKPRLWVQVTLGYQKQTHTTPNKQSCLLSTPTTVWVSIKFHLTWAGLYTPMQPPLLLFPQCKNTQFFRVEQTKVKLLTRGFVGSSKETS